LRKTILPTIYYLIITAICGMVAVYVLRVPDPTQGLGLLLSGG